MNEWLRHVLDAVLCLGKDHPEEDQIKALVAKAEAAAHDAEHAAANAEHADADAQHAATEALNAAEVAKG